VKTAFSKGYRISGNCWEPLLRLYGKSQTKGKHDSGNGRWVRNVMESGHLGTVKAANTTSDYRSKRTIGKRCEVGLMVYLFAFILLILYFMICPVLVLFPPMVIFMLLVNIKEVIADGFNSSPPVGVSLLVGLLMAISRLPFVRNIYQRFPWLNAYVIIMFANTAILEIAYYIIYIGYQVDNVWRHVLFIFLMCIQIIVCRWLLSLYVRWVKTRFLEGRSSSMNRFQKWFKQKTSGI